MNKKFKASNFHYMDEVALLKYALSTQIMVKYFLIVLVIGLITSLIYVRTNNYPKDTSPKIYIDGIRYPTYIYPTKTSEVKMNVSGSNEEPKKEENE